MKRICLPSFRRVPYRVPVRANERPLRRRHPPHRCYASSSAKSDPRLIPTANHSVSYSLRRSPGSDATAHTIPVDLPCSHDRLPVGCLVSSPGKVQLAVALADGSKGRNTRRRRKPHSLASLFRLVATVALLIDGLEHGFDIRIFAFGLHHAVNQLACVAVGVTQQAQRFKSVV